MDVIGFFVAFFVDVIIYWGFFGGSYVFLRGRFWFESSSIVILCTTSLVHWPRAHVRRHALSQEVKNKTGIITLTTSPQQTWKQSVPTGVRHNATFPASPTSRTKTLKRLPIIYNLVVIVFVCLFVVVVTGVQVR